MSDVPETSSARILIDLDADTEMFSEDKDQPNHEVVRIDDSSDEEQLAAQENPRVKDKQCFLHRCLDYKIKAKREKRIVVTISLLWNDDKTRSLFPLCICLARLDPNDNAERGELKYQATRMFTIRGSSKIDENGNTQVQANLLISKPAEEAISSKYYALILASVENPISLSEVNSTAIPWDVASNESRGGEKCLYQEVSFIDLYKTCDSQSTFRVKRKIEIQYYHCLLPCNLKYCFQRNSKCISIEDCSGSQDERNLKQLQISLSTIHPRATEQSYYSSHTSREVGSTSASLSRNPWLKEGSVSYKYSWYYNNKMRRMEGGSKNERKGKGT